MVAQPQLKKRVSQTHQNPFLLAAGNVACAAGGLGQVPKCPVLTVAYAVFDRVQNGL